MEYRSSEVKAGFFVCLSFVVMVVFVFFLGNVQDSFDEKRQLKIIFNFTGGLDIGAPVRYAGLDVGRVKDIQLMEADPTGRDRVAVVTEVNPKIHLRQNSTAMIKTAGLMGGLYIEIRPGTSKAKELASGETLLGQDSFEFDQVGDIMENFVAQIQRFTDLSETLIVESKHTLKMVQHSLVNVDHLVEDNTVWLKKNLKNMAKVSAELAHLMDKDKGEIRKVIHNVRDITNRTNKLLTEKEQNIHTIIEQTQNLTREVELLMADNRPGVTSFVRHVETDARKISGKAQSVMANLDSTLQQTNGILLENRRNMLEVVKNLKETTAHIKSFSADIERNPWKLVRKSDERSAPENQWQPVYSGNDPIRMRRLDKSSYEE